ncbi:hypoxanthine phosphoribosyltransferase [Pseudoflavonifractor sp. BIOML-A6]|nr:hypoxanthine phosphoribosyltransferase [Bacteroides thetaiotaomicron]MTQ98431.1 hypoxanthine phosphoribosyltransferase [Pseudoflavonifractor sp. BIOML-A16]MTR05610.1 hypoxanthine phosphoribosyltransferase [Pseudoflavonifractor sp. BIOML-A15]MTR14914.1 hypoxanthine phosphoribosyltransferase [Pseudoflavonifractor sp. BIOML-A17]MTR20824.1 hypoxanthine phosphoribosyltransferase [Pseudoflavonifractor sp. BIOML-A19]MTR34193.1 hypoxanthine phosphoribosyltransferase [Pseudoflavonifractor sp. BIOML-
MKTMLDQDIERVLFTEAQLDTRIGEIAAEMNRDYAGKEPVLISVLRGSFVFMADLTRKITLPCTVDFMSVSSYGAGTKSSGQVQITKDLSDDIEGRDIIVVEDILDSGNTLSYLLEILKARKPASVKLCTLLDKPDRRVKDVHVDYSGFTIPDEFVVGYGLDYAEKYRNLPYIGILKPCVYGGE